MSTHYNNWGLRINKERFYNQAKEFYKMSRYKNTKSISMDGDVFRVEADTVSMNINGYNHTFNDVNRDDKLFLFDQFLTAGSLEFIAFEWKNRKNPKAD